MKSAKIFIAIILITNSIGSAFASEINSNFKPFVMLDVSKEKDADTSKSKLANEYINANLTLGVKTPEVKINTPSNFHNLKKTIITLVRQVD